MRHPNAAAVLVLHLGCENLQHDQFVEEMCIRDRYEWEVLEMAAEKTKVYT